MAAVSAAALVVGVPSAVLAHDAGDTSPTKILAKGDVFVPSGSSDDSDNGYRVYLSSPRHSDSRYRGECNVGTSNGYEENINGRRWNWYAANTDYGMVGYSPTSHTRNIHGRGYRVNVSQNTRDDGYMDNIELSENWGSDMHIVTHSNADAGGCASSSASYTLLMWKNDADAHDDKDLATALYNQLSSTPGGLQIQQRTNLAELGRNAPLGDAYVEIAFHTKPYAQNWMHDETPYYAWLYGIAIDVYLNYPS